MLLSLLTLFSIYLFIRLHWVLVVAHGIFHCGAWALLQCVGFSSCGTQALLSSCGAWAPECVGSVTATRGLSSCGAWALECEVSVVAIHGFVALRHVGS